MPIVAGVDGCRGGWVVVRLNTRSRACERPVVLPAFADVLTLADPTPDVITLDLPVGLLDAPVVGGRFCDRAARARLGHPRASSVFSPPTRPCLGATSFHELTGLSRQAFGILSKIAEVDRSMTPAYQARVHEAHPELAFWALRGRQATVFNKKTVEGRSERVTALESAGHPAFLRLKAALGAALACLPRRDVAPDDIVDAYALAWTALRIATGQAERLPESPPRDAKGLRMEIWY